VINLKKRKGSSLIWVIVVSFLAITMAAVVSMFVITNAYAARRQREYTRAYYLVLAGMEVGSFAVLMRGLDDSFPVLNHFGDNLFTGNFEDEWFMEHLIFGPVASPPAPPLLAPHPDLPDYNGSEVEIIIHATNQYGERIYGSSPGGETVWVEVYVRAWYYNFGEWAQIQNDSSLRQQIGTPHAGRIRFNTNEPQWFIREIDDPRNLVITP